MARLNHLMACLVTSASVADLAIVFFLTAPEIRQICLCLWYVAFKPKLAYTIQYMRYVFHSVAARQVPPKRRFFLFFLQLRRRLLYIDVTRTYALLKPNTSLLVVRHYTYTYHYVLTSYNLNYGHAHNTLQRLYSCWK